MQKYRCAEANIAKKPGTVVVSHFTRVGMDTVIQSRKLERRDLLQRQDSHRMERATAMADRKDLAHLSFTRS